MQAHQHVAEASKGLKELHEKLPLDVFLRIADSAVRPLVVLHIPKTEQIIEKLKEAAVQRMQRKKKCRLDGRAGNNDNKKSTKLWKVDSGRRVSPSEDGSQYNLQVRQRGHIQAKDGNTNGSRRIRFTKDHDPSTTLRKEISGWRTDIGSVTQGR